VVLTGVCGITPIWGVRGRVHLCGEGEMKKYCVTYLDRIEAKEVIKETDHFVTYEYQSSSGKKTRREARTSNWSRYFDTFEEAKLYLVTKQTSHIESLKVQIESAKLQLKKFLELEDRS
jgi:hypothetical protein